jgi:UMP kinase
VNILRRVEKLSEPKYKRVLLKLSGEVLAGEQKTGVNAEIVGKICDKIKEVVEMGVQVAIVVGGGNFWRGRNGHQMERTTADYMGMLATAMNGLALQDALEARGVYSRVQTAIEMREIAEPFIQRKADKHLNRGRVVIFACGTGHPYFTTDTAAVLRATEIGADIILLGKNIDAVYSADPKLNPNAERFDEISYMEVLERDLKVMDSTATALCRDNDMPLLVFGISDPENIVRAIRGEKIGTIVK